MKQILKLNKMEKKERKYCKVFQGQFSILMWVETIFVSAGTNGPMLICLLIIRAIHFSFKISL